MCLKNKIFWSRAIFDDTYFETFQDGTYSQLNFIPKDNCQYRLEYVKSNNEMKSFINNMIDIKKTKYILLDENENYFTLAVSGINLDTFTIYEFYKKAQNVPKVNED